MTTTIPWLVQQALDIFAQFFVSPLMKADSSDRELESIESEFCLSKNSDACRLQELWCHTSKRGEGRSILFLSACNTSFTR